MFRLVKGFVFTQSYLERHIVLVIWNGFYVYKNRDECNRLTTNIY